MILELEKGKYQEKNERPPFWLYLRGEMKIRPEPRLPGTWDDRYKALLCRDFYPI